MKQKSWIRWVALAACAAMAVPFAATANAADAGQTPTLQQGVVSSRLANATGNTLVFIQTKGESGLAVSAKNGTSPQAREANRSAADAAANQSAATANGVFDQLKQLDANAKRVYTTSYTIPGVAVYADANAVRTLAERNANVVKVSPITLKTATDASTAAVTGSNATPANANNDALVRAISTWTQTGKTGKGVNIAIMDTGLDYTHADFGGPGTTEAYQQALSSATVPAGLYDSAKFLGGTDLAGSNYYPNDGVHVTPNPDDNPIDGEGGHHGTHVAGTAAGYGVKADGTSAKGTDYAKTSEADVRAMEIAPGSAPEAGIYSVKVFGDNGGSTGLVGAGLDVVAKYIAEGKQIDILSMSLGGAYGSADDPDTAKVNELTKQGVLSVVAAGNDGDFTDIMGSPATATSSLAVAASQSGGTLQDAITVNAPADLAAAHKQLAGQYSVNIQGAYAVTGKVVKLTDADATGCTPYTDAAKSAVKGNIVWVDWDDANVVCGSGTRFNNAQDAGATGILFASQSNLPSAGIGGNTTLPGFQVVKDSAAALKPALDAGTLNVTLSSDQRMALKVNYAADYQDVVADFTSRGIHGSADGTVKPDVSAPGVGIVSASAGTGTKPEVMSGTSMATPLTSGVAALAFQTHPDWTPEQIKALVMNTADHDVTITKDGKALSPLRSGTGRIDALNVVNNPVTVAATDDPTAVTGQFGIVQVPAEGYTATKSFTVKNTSDKPVTYDVAYVPRTETPGVTYTVSTKTLTVAAKGTATFDVTLNIPDQSALRHTRDTTQPERNPATAEHATNYVTDASGIVRLAPVKGSDAAFSALRVAVSSAPKPVSETASSLTFTKGSKDGTLAISGHGFQQGDGAEAYASQVAPMQLLTEDPAGDEVTSVDSARSASAGDIRAFAFTSTAPQLADPSQGYLAFGLQTDKTWSLVNSNVFMPEITLDTNADGLPDAFVSVNSAEPGTPKPTPVDATWVETSRINCTAAGCAIGEVIDSEPLATATVADSNVIVLPVKLSALGIDKNAKSAPIQAYAQIESMTAANVSTTGSAVADKTAVVAFDALNPSLWFGEKGQKGSGTYLYADADGTTVAAHQAADAKASKAEALVLRLNAKAPVRSDDQVTNIDIQTPQTVVPVDKAKLQTLVDSAAGLKQADYTADSWKTFADALAAAKQVLANKDATQQQVDNATAALQTAINGLKKTTPQVDKTKLQGLVDAVKGLAQGDYTAETWTAFQSALKSAQDVLANTDASQQQVNDAYAALKAAYDGLAKPADNNGGTTDNDQNNNGQPSGTVVVNGNKNNGKTNGKDANKLSATGAAVGTIAVLAVIAAAVGAGAVIVRRRNANR